MDESDDRMLGPRLRTMQIIVFALVMGVLSCAAVFVYLVQATHNGHGFAPPQGPPVMSLVGVAMLAGLSMVSFVFPNVLVAQGVRRIARGEWQPPRDRYGRSLPASFVAADPARLLALYQTAMIVGLAHVEGAAFYCCIAYFLEGQPWMLALIALALLLQVARFPTETRVRTWLGRQLDVLEQERGRAESA